MISLFYEHMRDERCKREFCWIFNNRISGHQIAAIYFTYYLHFSDCFNYQWWIKTFYRIALAFRESGGIVSKTLLNVVSLLKIHYNITETFLRQQVMKTRAHWLRRINWKVHFSKLPEICFPKFLRLQQFIPSKKASVLLEYLKTEKPSIWKVKRITQFFPFH